MKLVIAVVRPDRLGAVLEELFRSEVQGLTISRVQGHGGEREHVETYRGTTVKMELSGSPIISCSQPCRRSYAAPVRVT